MTTDPTTTTDRLRAIAQPVCEGAGYELWDVRLTQSPGGWILRVTIDVPGQVADATAGVTFADCERVSRELSAVLDVEDPIEQAYSLEVSSPGIDRTLRTEAHFCRYIGEVVKVTLAEPVDGRRRFSGTLTSAGDGQIAIDIDGAAFELPIDAIASARVVPDWDALMPRSKPGRGGRADNKTGKSGKRGANARKRARQ